MCLSIFCVWKLSFISNLCPHTVSTSNVWKMKQEILRTGNVALARREKQNWYDTKDIVSIVLFKSFWEIFCNLFLLRCSLLVWSFRDPFTTRPVRTVFRYSDQVYRPLFTCILMYNKNNSNLSLKRNVFKLILSLVVLSPVPPLSNIHIS